MKNIKTLISTVAISAFALATPLAAQSTQERVGDNGAVQKLGKQGTATTNESNLAYDGDIQNFDGDKGVVTSQTEPELGVNPVSGSGSKSNFVAPADTMNSTADRLQGNGNRTKLGQPKY